MRTISALALLVGAVLGFPAAAQATPFSAKGIPATAEGVIHIDLDGIRASQTWNIVTDEHDVMGEIESDIRSDAPHDWSSAEIDLALKVLGSAHSATFWVDANESGALLVELPRAIPVSVLLKKLAPAKSPRKGGIQMYRLSDKDDGYLAVYRGTLILSDDPDAVVASARVLQGKAKSLSPGHLGVGTGAKGLFLVAGFHGQLMKVLRQSAQTRALSADIRGVVVHVGEQKDRLFVAARIDTNSAATAQKMASVLNGFSALASIAADDPEVTSIANNVSVVSKGASVTARLEVPLDVVAELIEQ